MAIIKSSFWLHTIIWVLITSACSVSTPEQTTRNYLEALAAGKSDVAWSLLSDSAKQQISKETHRARVYALTPKQKALLRQAAQDPKRTGYHLQWTNRGEDLKLKHKGGNAWTLIGPLPRFYRLDTPQRALETFTEAFNGNDFEALMQLIPKAERKGLDAGILRNRFSREDTRLEVRATLKALAENDGGRALPKNGWRFEKGNHRVDFVLEDNRWRVNDLR